MEALLEIARQFDQSVSGFVSLGNGLINDTYLVTTQAKPFVLQKINRQVFPNPELIMLNLMQLNQHLAVSNQDEIGLVIPALVQSKDGQLFVIDGHSDYWRAWEYIENTDCLENFRNLAEAEQVGAALGKFHRLCHGLDTAQFHDTLPGFHITPDYYAQYQNILKSCRVPKNPECVEFIIRHQYIIDDLEMAKTRGLLTLRITHGDPKLNNFLFDKASGKVVSLIDLDTVKPGLIHYDIGDCLRSCCHNTADDSFNLAICEAVLSGYLGEMAGLLTKHDYEFLYPAIRLIPFELGLRFYTDYLDGNRYFKVTEPDQNLQRALNQFQLCESVAREESAIKELVQRTGG